MLIVLPFGWVICGYVAEKIGDFRFRFRLRFRKSSQRHLAADCGASS